MGRLNVLLIISVLRPAHMFVDVSVCRRRWRSRVDILSFHFLGPILASEMTRVWGRVKKRKQKKT